jgi:L-alanine-DL-glutamate epimerase-like enolase superfamily enzyme
VGIKVLRIFFSHPARTRILSRVKITSIIQKLQPRTVFRISREERHLVENVLVAIESDGLVGYGEASPNSFYNETAAKVSRLVSGLADFFQTVRIDSIQDIENVWNAVWPKLSPSRAAQCAVDVALWDLLGKKRKVTCTRLAHGRDPSEIITSCTIGISKPDEIEAKVLEVKSFPVIKVKMDQTADLGVLRFINERAAGAIRVDANCAWSSVDIASLSRQLAALRVEFIEQPLPPSEDDRMPEILEASALPILADESCVELADVERVSGRFSGFNIKLVKCGGITPGLNMLRRAQALGLKTMVGCMLETSVLIAAGAVVAQETDYADLDGSWLIKDDPFSGIEVCEGRLRPTLQAGLGVAPQAALFEQGSDGH